MTSQNISVLICEDDLGIRRLMTTLLDREGVSVCTAEDGEGALAEIARQEPDLIVLDLMMANVGGLDVIAWLKEHRPHLLPRVIVVTAAGVNVTQILESEPIARLIQKPFDIDEFRDVVLRFQLPGSTHAEA